MRRSILALVPAVLGLVALASCRASESDAAELAALPEIRYFMIADT